MSKELFAQQRHFGTLYNELLYQKVIHCNTGSYCGHITVGVNTYLYMRVSILVPVCYVCTCRCLWYQIIMIAKITS